MAQDEITDDDVREMLQHWLGTPENGYLGQRYGNALPEVVHAPMLLAGTMANHQIAKLRRDIPYFDAETVDLYQHDLPPSGRVLVVDVGGRLEIPY
ncbi:hypothetical protein X805_23830 [Sphaerotilus natans subsp. natans DSM 6575]|uniref:Uncharacterized protein n=1 Tax=Sphaerotilus natans subsp. natans DSM 6575 TaxID=1286631 RepID=A0A059KLR4_9BURK|nr:hypothetical protein [Sphaerotilus natans]KDB52013.1 hypothetical protein X805_23830 [Sphaerotilus natans subsp. natans DSM 6575]SIQ08520.1 hypothetical protein SAMN05421778_101315 [Sphaerotilus natans]